MLVVVDDGNDHLRFPLCLDYEAFRSLDVFEFDLSKGPLQPGHGFLNRRRVTFIHLRIDVGEHIEQNGLAFHHGLGRHCADSAKAQNRPPVRDHGNDFGQPGLERRFARIFGDLFTGNSNTGPVCAPQIVLLVHRLDLKFSGPVAGMIDRGLGSVAKGHRDLPLSPVRSGRHSV